VAVAYTVTVANSMASTLTAALNTAVTSGALTTSLVSAGYTGASASTLVATVDRSPTSAPTFHGASKTASCFAGSETVSLESGEMKAISEVNVGDRVLSANADGKTSFSEIVYVPHGANKESTIFVQVTTASGRDVKMTPNHILASGVCGSTLPLVYASKVSVGNCIQTVSGEEKVSMVESVRGEGVYTIVTKEEFIVVNGIIASPFGANHMLANMFYNVHRFVYAISPMLLASNLLHNANEELGMMIPLFGPSPKTF
jgi:Hint module